MPILNNNDISIYFGDSSDQLFMSDKTYDTFQNAPELLNIEPFSPLRSMLGVERILFPRQVHGRSGILVDAQTLLTTKPFSIQADYLITNLPGIGIGVLTADCLPILLHDTANQAIAVIHAGWRGSVAGIATKALNHMHSAFATSPANVHVFFGPSAGQCCYSVGPELIEAVKPYPDQVLTSRSNQTFFDLAGYNRFLLENAGVLPSAFCNDYVQCTICHDQFWSYRRQNKLAGRQMTVISLPA